MDSRKLALRCRELADNRKAENLVILDVRELSSVADYFVIASGTSEPHLRAIVEEITDKLREEDGLRPRAVDGSPIRSGQVPWIVLDYFDVLVHVMRQDVRERYDLETLWGDAPRVHKPEAGEQKSEASLSRQHVSTKRSEGGSAAKAGVLKPEARKRRTR